MDAKEQLRGSTGDQNGDLDRFPDGMRVLAVDDDLTYLKILEATLRKCNYEVTTANDAYQALQILRENRNNFDLVISDVHMPDMDGFQLLKQLGDEMDLPVIMVSCNGDNEFIKKGISHGACCYLVKPVNIEVFKTIWQHAFRRKSLSSKDQRKSSDHNLRKGIEEGEDDEDWDEKPSTPKKRRVVWTEELKKKFNDVYYYLGPEKAVPKKILELMNVEGLSRGNVASHLQKFREHMKKGSINQDRQRASMVVDRGRNSSYMPRTDLIDKSGGRLLNAAPLPSYMPSQMVSRSNTRSSVMQRIAPSHLLRPGQSQTLCSHYSETANLQPSVVTNQSRNCFPVSHTPVGLFQLQQKDTTVDIGQSTLNNNGYTTTFPYNSMLGSSMGDQSALGVNSLNPELFDNALCRSSTSRYSDSCQGGMQGCGQLYQLPSPALLRSEDSDFGLLPANKLGTSSNTPQVRNTPDDFSSIGALSIPNIWREDDKQDYNNWNLPSIVSGNHVVDSGLVGLNQNDAACGRINLSMFDQFSWENTTIGHNVGVENSTMQIKVDPNDGLVQNNVESPDNQVCSDMINQTEMENELDFLDREFGLHA
ncbi:two-component response regulator ARR12-like [Argentina anserina]|uniref:two-component response regulator ARR12-like n=1 Tax=Argentina anserina TaxID=57926 RepID=UPI0021765D77|nr:two-component response regulator ARR12-like [Potentilla anserina]